MRESLAEKLELIGQVFEIDGVDELCGKIEEGIKTIKFNAVVIQISGKIIKANPKLADKLVAMRLEIEEKDVAKLEDKEFGDALKAAIIKDVFGFFASSPPSDGTK